MNTRKTNVIASFILGGFCIGATCPALALSMKECSAKYKAAQAAGSLNGQNWNEFRKAECGSDAKTAAGSSSEAGQTPAAPTSSSAPPKPATAPETTIKPAPETSSAPAQTEVVFPSAISQKYSSEAPGKARMHTCLDQYNSNKTSGGNGTLKWIQKGGGYFSECSKRLKGS